MTTYSSDIKYVSGSRRTARDPGAGGRLRSDEELWLQWRRWASERFPGAPDVVVDAAANAALSAIRSGSDMQGTIAAAQRTVATRFAVVQAEARAQPHATPKPAPVHLVKRNGQPYGRIGIWPARITALMIFAVVIYMLIFVGIPFVVHDVIPFFARQIGGASG
jgi:hypothetical protein